MKRPLNYLFSALVVLLFSGSSFSAHNIPEVFSKIHQVNQLEIVAGKIALKKAQTNEVKNFAALLIKDHALADAKVLRFLKSRNLELLRVPFSPAEENMLKKLRHTRGAQFEKVFLKEMVKGHNMVLSDLGRFSHHLRTDQEALQLLKEIRVPIKRHLKMAKLMLTQSSRP